MARVIRRESFQSGRVYSLRDVKAQADAQLDQAREQAEALLRDARQQAEQLFEQRKAEGYRTGFKQGHAAGLESLDEQTRRRALEDATGKMDALTQSLSAALTAFEEEKRCMLAAAESGMIQLACAIARRVCKAIPNMSLDAARANVRAVLELAQHEYDVRLHVNPDDLDGLREIHGDLCGRIERFEHVEFVSDPNVARGGCVLHGKLGSIDASIDAQLQHVADSILTSSAGRPERSSAATMREAES